MKSEALKIIGGSLSKPSKMPGWSIGLPAKECKTGGKLQEGEGLSLLRLLRSERLLRLQGCSGCTIPKTGSIQDPAWVEAMAHLIKQQKAGCLQMA